MPRLPSFSRAWPRVAVFTVIAVAAASCADSARFESGPTAYNQPRPPESTGTISRHQAYPRYVEAQPLPAPKQPPTVTYSGVSNGGQGLGAYRPATRTAEYTGSMPSRREIAAPPPAPPPPPAPSGHWTWDGGSPVIVHYGESIESIARRFGVPASAILQTNGIANPESVRPGQRLVIPRYVSTSAPRYAMAKPSVREPAPAPAPALAPAPRTRTPVKSAENDHIVEPGETLMGIAHRHGITLAALAGANNIKPYATINVGDHLKIPGGRHVAEHRVPPPKVEKPRTVAAAADQVSSIPTQTARIAKPEVQEPKPATKTAEAAGGLPSFRWPVRGRIIASFGPRPNGTQNDGINLAVPEGTPIKAADDGVVAYAGNELKGYGNLVLVRHADGYVSAYANASELLVKRGETVKRGQVIAHAGQTGNVSSPQLHFEIRKGSTPIDPMRYLNGG